MSTPRGVITDSGWNCTPSIGKVLWRRPISEPSSARAVGSRQSGSVPASATRLW